MVVQLALLYVMKGMAFLSAMGITDGAARAAVRGADHGYWGLAPVPRVWELGTFGALQGGISGNCPCGDAGRI